MRNCTYAAEDTCAFHMCATDVCLKRAHSKCARCGHSWYCSRACQKKDWPLHKTVCHAPRKPRARNTTDKRRE